MWLNFFNFDLKIIRQGSVFIICKKSLKILTLSMLKHAEMVCQKSADPGSPRVKDSVVAKTMTNWFAPTFQELIRYFEICSFESLSWNFSKRCDLVEKWLFVNFVNWNCQKTNFQKFFSSNISLYYSAYLSSSEVQTLNIVKGAQVDNERKITSIENLFLSQFEKSFM